MDKGSDSVLKLGTFWFISGKGLLELVKHGAATNGEDKAEDTDEVFVEVVEVMIEAVVGVC